MQLNRRTDYALRTLLFLATLGEGERLSTLDEISEKFQIARDHLVKIVGKLAKLNYIKTTRGKGGGIKFNPATLEVSLYEIVMHFESSLEMVDCDHLLCPARGACRLKLILNEATQSFINVLQRYKFSDILPKNTQEIHDMRKKLGIPVVLQKQ